MINESGNGMYMPVAPAGYGNNDMFGGNGLWFLLIWMAMFGWGGNGFGFGNNNSYSEVQRGFDQNAVMTGIQGIQNAVQNVFSQAEISANGRQMADMNQNFALQSSVGDLKYAVATEACADRNAITSALRDVLEANNASTQRILDQMCNDKIDAKNETISMLRQQLTMANLAASQNAQTATILANNEAQTAALEHYLNPAPIPAYTVPAPYSYMSPCNGCSC